MDTEEGFSSNKLIVNVKQEKVPIGIRRQKSGRYGAVITDQIRRKKVWIGTFDTIEQASQAYFSKKSELDSEKISRRKKGKRILGVHKRKKRGKRIWLDAFGNNAENANCVMESGVDVPISYSCNGGTNRRIDSQEIVTTEEALRIAKEASKVFNSCLMVNVSGTKLSDECSNTTGCAIKDRISIIGIRRRKSGRYQAVITDPIQHKEVSLGTFDTIEEASHAYQSKKLEFEELRQRENKENELKKNCDQIQQPESPSVVASLDTAASASGRDKRIDFKGKEPGSSKATSCLMSNFHVAESSYECNITTSCDPKARRSLVGIRRRKSGRYAAVITDPIRHKEVCLGTFDTIEEASQAYWSKKSEFQKLRQGNCDQIQQPESPSVVASVDTASGSGRDKRIDYHKTTHIVGAHKKKMSGKYTSESRNPITKKKIWLGTFGTDEEASLAYQSKKLEVEKLVNTKQQQGTDKQTHSKQDAGEEKLVNVKQVHENVNCELKGQVDDEDIWMGGWVQLPGDDREVMFSLKLGLPIIDNYGYLLGEFSTLDNLSVCVTEDDNQT